MWTDQSLWKLKNSIERPEPEAAEPKEVFVISAASNPRFVYGVLDGLRIPIECRPSDSQRILKKNIKVDVRVENGETYYRHIK